MANCNEIFIEFNDSIRLNNERRVLLREKRNDLRKRINDGYDIIKNVDKLNHNMEFQSQGSYVMDTIINPIHFDDQYDLDDGVYFIGNLSRNDRPVPSTFHNWIIRSIEEGKSDNEIEEIKDKNTCVRVIYKGRNGDLNYHIDLPIYYAVDIEKPDLADKREWRISNPIEFIIWFENKIQSGFKKEFILESQLYENEYNKWLSDIRKRDHQLRRIVRYLKAWGDYVGDMPPGIIMTILAGENYSEDLRDDVSLKNTLVNINSWLKINEGRCPRPTTPVGEDLFKNYPVEKKETFIKALNNFIDDAINAIQNPNKKESCENWQKHLGSRYSCENVKDENDYSSLSTAAAKSDMWSI